MNRNTCLGALSVALLTIGLGLSSCAKNEPNKKNQGGKKTNTTEKTFTLENIDKAKPFSQTSTFNGLKPGEELTFKFYAGKGQSLVLTTMYGASVDWFFGSDPAGIPLFDANGKALTGDRSSLLSIWDAGVMTDDKKAENPVKGIAKVSGKKASDYLMLSLAFDEKTSQFTATLTNVSNKMANQAMQTPVSPGVFSVAHSATSGNEYFAMGKHASAELVSLSTKGMNEPLNKVITGKTGIFTGLSPILVVAYRGDVNPIFEVGKEDKGLGLKELSQKGDASRLKASLEKVKGVHKVYIIGKSAILPGGKVSEKIDLPKGVKLAYATMFGVSNDWFYANATGIENAEGDLTAKTDLYDSGTGVDEYPGAGAHQAAHSGTPLPEKKAIQKVSTTAPIPAVAKVLRITVR